MKPDFYLKFIYVKNTLLCWGNHCPKNVHLREAHRSWEPEANPLGRGEAESTTIGLPRATNLSVHSDVVPPTRNTLGRQLSQFKNPFAPSIMEATLHSNWENLIIDKYDGTTDLEEHLDIYTTQVSLYTKEDMILYRVFPTSLKGHTLHWFTRLPLNSVDSFDTLATHFGT